MEKKFFTGMAVLLIASLFFLGCPTDDGGEEENNSNNSADNWYDGLGDVSETANTVTLTADTTLSAGVTVPNGKTLVINSGATLTVPAATALKVDTGATLTVTGTLAGTDETSKLELGTGVTATVAGASLTAGTYVWDGVWLTQADYDAAVTAATALAANAALTGKATRTGTKVTLTADVSLTAAVTVPKDVTLSVPKDKTLAIGTGSLVVTGTLAGAADGAVYPYAAAKIVVSAAANTVTGADDFYPATGSTAMAAVAAGTYVWDAKAGGDSSKPGWKQLEAVTASYSLKEELAGTNAVNSGVTLVSALKNNAANTVTVKLGGKFKAEYLYYGDGKIATAAKAGTAWNVPDWGSGTDETLYPQVGQYGAVYINGIFPEAKTNVATESRNPGLRFYTGADDARFSADPLEKPGMSNVDVNHLPADGSVPQRWTMSQNVAADKTSGVLLFSGAADKFVTLDITTAASYDADAARTPYLTVIIDYSDVDFTATGTVTDVAANTYTLKKSEGTNDAVDSGLNLVSAKKNAATNVVTIKLGGTFDGKYLYTGDGTAATAGKAGSEWEAGMWGNGSDATYSPAAGKYGPVYVNGYFGSSPLTDVAIQIKPYPGLLFYTGDTTPNRPSSALLKGPSATTTNYISADGSVTQRWKLYGTVPANDTFGVLLFSGAADKTVTLDIDTYSGGSKASDVQTVIIDYTDVVFP
jgi:hypothetical protein